MITRNECLANISPGYLFPEIAKRRREFSAEHPEAQVISLGIGNTTEPITPHIKQAMIDYVAALGTSEGYSGYGDEQGSSALRQKIADVFYKGMADADEVFISDGAKCDIGRIQTLFGSKVSVAVQDPAYPVYVDGSVLIGAAGAMSKENATYEGITYMPCTPENGFFPDLSAVKENSLIYFCSPNNPTGCASTREELTQLVQTAREKGCIIIYDAAYFAFIRDEHIPKTIFEIEGARECAIEINSFSKPVGFTGIRLGWSVVPKNLTYADGTPIIADWNRIMTTIFNGASNIAQAGGLAALDTEGLKEMQSLTDYYLENARLIKAALEKSDCASPKIRIYGDGNSPYLWVHFPGKKSWDVFDALLEKCHIVTTPGIGFGFAGEGFVRFSSFGHRESVQEACKRLENFTV
ncbi:MAG: LL-diaminopimelate aminotransferase [Spirochaetales bacterium]